jgi:hypothetical protein
MTDATTWAVIRIDSWWIWKGCIQPACNCCLELCNIFTTCTSCTFLKLRTEYQI